jgi:hypothetical protein
MDSMRVDAMPLNSGVSPEPQVHHIVRMFLDNLRVASQQWWITRGIDPLVGWQMNCFEIDSFGTPAEDTIGTAAARTLFGHERLVSDQIWQSALQSTERGLKSGCMKC